MALNRAAQLVRRESGPTLTLISSDVGILHPIMLVEEDQTGYTPRSLIKKDLDDGRYRIYYLGSKNQEKGGETGDDNICNPREGPEADALPLSYWKR